jgi:amino-acid N-acetyltransferase
MNEINNTEIINNNAATTNWFRTAAPYIHAHRNSTFVIAFDGTTIASASFDSLIHDLALLSSLGIRLVLAYGARPQIEQQCTSHNIPVNYHQGLRVTDDASLKVAKAVIGRLRLDIEAKLSFSLPHTPMADAQIRCTSGNLVTAQPVGIKDGVDFQHTGKVRRIDGQGIEQQLQQGNLVLLPPLGFSPTGETFNLSLISVATEAAIELGADKLIIIGNDYSELARELTTKQANDTLESLPEDEQATLQAAIQALNNGVKRVHLLDRTMDGALLQELFSRDGAGILITPEPFETTREANIDDVGGILEIIRPLEEQGTLVKRSLDLLEMEIDHFTVLERDGSIVGCAALYPYLDNKAAELACLAVIPDYQDLGRGKQLLATLEKQAKSAGLTSLYTLTTQTTHWFIEHGFKPAQINDLPVEKQQFYNYQRNSKVLKKTL